MYARVYVPPRVAKKIFDPINFLILGIPITHRVGQREPAFAWEPWMPTVMVRMKKNGGMVVATTDHRLVAMFSFMPDCFVDRFTGDVKDRVVQKPRLRYRRPKPFNWCRRKMYELEGVDQLVEYYQDLQIEAENFYYLAMVR